MARPVFGVDEPPPAAPPGSMAYIARARCGHVRAIQVDTRASSVDDFVGLGLAGLTLERIPTAQAKAELGECDVCRDPEQIGAGL